MLGYAELYEVISKEQEERLTLLLKCTETKNHTTVYEMFKNATYGVMLTHNQYGNKHVTKMTSLFKKMVGKDVVLKAGADTINFKSFSYRYIEEQTWTNENGTIYSKPAYF